MEPYWRLTVRPASLFCAFMMLTTNASSAESTIPAGHSVVNVVFITPLTPTNPMLGGMGPEPKAWVGDMLVPIDQINEISVSIDDAFVGHAMVGFGKITPTFILPSGIHEFSFTCDGFKPVSRKLTVVGTGSNQYLLVRMQKIPDTKKVSDTARQDPTPASLGLRSSKR